MSVEESNSASTDGADKTGTEISRRRAALGGAALAGALAAPNVSKLGLAPRFASAMSIPGVEIFSNCFGRPGACFTIPQPSQPVVVPVDVLNPQRFTHPCVEDTRGGSVEVDSRDAPFLAAFAIEPGAPLNGTIISVTIEDLGDIVEFAQCQELAFDIETLPAGATLDFTPVTDPLPSNFATPGVFQFTVNYTGPDEEVKFCIIANCDTP